SSPELLPTNQSTENIIGEYELHDFFLYHMIRFGQAPNKTITLACKAFNGKYNKYYIVKCLKIFIQRFFCNQFKRNCSPEGVKIINFSLSPRADWRMASNSNYQEWINLIEKYHNY
ncbi:MAG: hypothetical protein LBM05_02370, partial [Endomicrobium sp.]|nr:hypothetical protein [Endomicrobium sp.]